jgi:flagellar hook-length control protein FliK
MTIAPLGVVPSPAAPGAAPDAAAPADFMTAIQAALKKMGVEPPTPGAKTEAKTEAKTGTTKDVEPVETTDEPDVEPVEMPAPTAVPDYLAALVGQYSLVPTPRPPPVGTHPDVATRPDVEPVETRRAKAQTKPLPALTPPVMDEPTKAPAANPGPTEPNPLANRADVELVETYRTQTQTQTQPTARHLDKLDVQAPTLPATSQPSFQAVPAITHVQVATPAAPVANTTPLDRVAAQVFPEVTSLVSRGAGTHRIALTLNPEHLGEVRVVMTVRAGAVHVRLAAGQEARLSLADGSGELSRLLEHAGATEVRVVVRDLPATAPGAASTNPSTPTTDTSSTSSSGLTGDRSPDQHAGTRADHQARDGSDHTPRSIRTDGSTAGVTLSIKPVTGARAAGLDLTM